MTIYLGASCLSAHRNRAAGGLGPIPEEYYAEDPNIGFQVEADLQDCLDALRKMQPFNNVARDHLNVLQSQDFTTNFTQLCTY